MHIMDPLHLDPGYKGRYPSMPYIDTLHYIAKKFNLVMKLANPAWNDNIYYWKREFPTCVSKTIEGNNL